MVPWFVHYQFNQFSLSQSSYSAPGASYCSIKIHANISCVHLRPPSCNKWCVDLWTPGIHDTLVWEENRNGFRVHVDFDSYCRELESHCKEILLSLSTLKGNILLSVEFLCLYNPLKVVPSDENRTDFLPRQNPEYHNLEWEGARCLVEMFSYCYTRDGLPSV